MGLFSFLKSPGSVLSVTVPRPDYLASPFSTGELSKIVYSDLFGANYAPLTRAEAMSIPPLSKARNLICATIAGLPLRAANKDGLLPDDQQPSFLYRTDSAVSPYLRMLYTADDLLFYGRSLWAVTRGSEGQILTADRVPIEWWKVSNKGEILIDEKPVNDDQVIYFAGPIDGLLDKDGRTLRAAISVADSLESRAKAPIPVMEIHATGTDEITPAEAEALVRGYNIARRDTDGATVFTPASVQLIPHGDQAGGGFMTDGRNAIRLDIANITGVPAALLDGSTAQSTLTYSTQEGRRNEFVDYGLAPWIGAIAGRLSADDVVPRGQHVVFDQSDFATTTPSPIGPEAQD